MFSRHPHRYQDHAEHAQSNHEAPTEMSHAEQQQPPTYTSQAALLDDKELPAYSSSSTSTSTHVSTSESNSTAQTTPSDSKSQTLTTSTPSTSNKNNNNNDNEAHAPAYHLHASLDDPNVFVSVSMTALQDPSLTPKPKTLREKIAPPPPTKPVLMMRKSIYERYFNYDARSGRYLGTEAEFTGRRLLQEGRLRVVAKEKEGRSGRMVSARGEARWQIVEVR